MAAACSSPPRKHVGTQAGSERVSGASGVKSGPAGATPERPSSHNTASPEESCAICLGAPENKSFTDSCFHTFCFACLAEWAKVKAECPLCKQRFKSIIHSVRSLEDYDQYFVSELQRPSHSAIDYFDRRLRNESTMTLEGREELEEMRLYQMYARNEVVAASLLRHQNRSIPRGAITSSDRQLLYGLNLWAVPSYSQFREASPRFYRDNPGSTHRLYPWLNRELNALLPSPSGVRQVMDIVTWLIRDYDIRHPDFATTLHCFLDQRTEHFVYEFYLFATSVHDMVEYDRRTVYKSRSQAYSRGDPIERFRVALAKQNRTAPPPATTRRESPQPGPSGLGATRPAVAASVASDSDSDSSDCILVRVVKPQRERMPVIIEVETSSDDAGDLTTPGPSRDRRSERAVEEISLRNFSAQRSCPPESDSTTRSSPGSRSDRDRSPALYGSPELHEPSPAGSSALSEIGNSQSESEHPPMRNSRKCSRFPHAQRQRSSSSGTSVESTQREAAASESGEHSRHAHSAQKPEHVADDWETSSDEDSRPPSQAKTRQKLGSIVVSVIGGRKSPIQNHHGSRRRRCDRGVQTNSPKQKRARPSSS